VQACTDVTGFGLIGHLHQMALASGVGARLSLAAVPVLPEAWVLAWQDCVPDGTRNNLNDLADHVEWARGVSPVARLVLSDAQTSGGLLIAVPRPRARRLLKALAQRAVTGVVIGDVTAGPAGLIRVEK
jgi:selenide,water dikinase